MREVLPGFAPKWLLALALLLCGGAVSAARGQEVAAAPEVVRGTLHELHGKRNVLLLIARSSVVDAQESGQGIIDTAFKTTFRQTRRYSGTFNVIARKLNDYMKKHRSISAVQEVENADFIVFFNLLEYRRSLGSFYPHGELYVILNRPPQGQSPPRILWKSRKVMWAEDAVNDLIKALKAARGEK